MIRLLALTSPGPIRVNDEATVNRQFIFIEFLFIGALISPVGEKFLPTTTLFPVHCKQNKSNIVLTFFVFKVFISISNFDANNFLNK